MPAPPRPRSPLLLLLTFAAAGCAPDLPVPDPGAQLLYDPLGGTTHAFPDDFYTVADGKSPTGRRVHIVPGDNLSASADFDKFHKLFDDLSLLDGFGTTGKLFVHVQHPIDETSLPPSGDGSGASAASLLLVDMDPAARTRFIDFEWKAVPENGGGLDDSVTIVLSPMRPLAPRHEYGIAVTRKLLDANHNPVAPSPATRAILDGSAGPPLADRVARVHALRDLLEAAGASGDLAGAITFTTGHTVDDSAEIARAIGRSRGKHVLRAASPCTDDAQGGYRACEATLDGADYRRDHLYVDEASLVAQADWKLPVTIYLPLGTKGPYPTLLYGHGLGGDRHQAAQLAALAAPKGYAVVACDAVKHGDHPDRPSKIVGDPRLDTILDFFGFGLGKDLIDARKLRDNFRQSTYDKLQLIEGLRPGVDADGDGAIDVGLDRFLYLGVSLGGIMSAELLAFAPDVRIAIPIVPGARVTEIVESSKTFSVVINLFRASATDGDVARFFPLLQAAVDRGDSGAYAGHILHDRLPGFDARVPQALMQMVIDDDTVPNPTNRYFARALGAPHAGDELQRIGALPRTGPLPLRGNLDATHTAGVFQYDVVWEGNGPGTRPATHGNVAANPVAITQTLRFIESGLGGGAAELIDPYRVLGIKK